jgi:large subunit ribosomal protein L1
MPKLTKRQREVAELYDRDQYYTLEDAVALAKKLSRAKFDETL